MKLIYLFYIQLGSGKIAVAVVKGEIKKKKRSLYNKSDISIKKKNRMDYKFTLHSC